jgi:ABC-type lipoprotein export system ATPase subunit
MLEIRNLVKIYPGPVTALAGVDLDIPSGMFGLLGPNGAGKSTFMRILAGLLEPTSGNVALDGHDVIADPAWLRARLGYLPQEFGFYPHLSGEKMLMHLLRLKGIEAPGGLKQLCKDLLERVNLSFAAKRAVKSYSGGMRQRLGIAQAIAGDPRLVIVDEPTAGPRSRGAAALLPPARRAGAGPDRPPLDPHRRGRRGALPRVRGHPRGPTGRTHHAARRARGDPGRDLRRNGRACRPARAAPGARGHAGAAGRGQEPRARLCARPRRASGLRAGPAVARGRLPGAHAAAGAGGAGVNFGRFFEVLRLELSHNVRRPLFWVQVLILLFLAQQLATGNASIQSGDARVGGTKAWLTSEFANTQVLIVLVSALYVFFISVGAGMSLIKDDELRVGEVLRATRLTPAEYVWGKFVGVFLAYVGVLVLHVGGTIICNHLLPHGANADSIGPFALGNYLRPALVFALPSMFLFAGACFAVGALTKQPVLVFALPILVLIAGFSLLWEWSPEWLAPSVNRLLQFVDMTGLRWINQVYLKVDRGVDFYNHARVGLDGLMLAQRLVVVLLGIGSVQLVVARLSARARVTGAQAKPKYEPALPPAEAADPVPLHALGMRAQATGFVADMLEVARTEFRLLGRHPGLYLFVPLILLQVFGGLVNTGAFDTPLLQTPGSWRWAR